MLYEDGESEDSDHIEVEMVDDDDLLQDEHDIEGLMFDRNKVLFDDLAPTRNTFKQK